jgi:hypothetical protein
MDADDEAAVLTKGLWMATRGWEIFIEHDENGTCAILATRTGERASVRVPARHTA